MLLRRASLTKAYDIELPAGEPVENAAAGVIAVYNAENPDVVLVEPTPRDKILAGLLAASLGASVISDVTAIDGRCCHQHVLRWLGGEQAEG